GTCRRSSWPRWIGWTGSTTNDCRGRSGTSRQRKPKRLTIDNKQVTPKRRDSYQTVFEILGAVQSPHVPPTPSEAMLRARVRRLDDLKDMRQMEPNRREVAQASVV